MGGYSNKKLLVTNYVAVYFVIQLLFGFSPSASMEKGESWNSALEKAMSYRISGDCTKAWEILWDSRNYPDSFSYLLLSNMAELGMHPVLPNDEKVSQDIAFKLALLAGKNGQLLKMHELDRRFPKDLERYGMTLSIGRSLGFIKFFVQKSNTHEKSLFSCNIEKSTKKNLKCASINTLTIHCHIRRKTALK